MKLQTRSLLAALGVGSLCLVTAAPAHATDTQHYGKHFVAEVAEVSVGDLLDHPDLYVGKRVQVKGVVTDVCTHRGCWIKIGGEEGKTVRFKVTDGEIVFPIESKGKRATAQGVFTKLVISKEDLIKQAKHHAKEGGKPFDPASISADKVIYQLKGEAAELR